MDFRVFGFDSGREVSHYILKTISAVIMQIFKPSLLELAFLAGCDGNPFIEVPVDPDAPSDFPLVGETENAVRGKAITRVENFDVQSGNGYAQGYIYYPDTDTFLVDNLAFDGENVYVREGTMSTGVAVVNIDFADFNDTNASLGDAVSIEITDRQTFDINGNNVTQEIVDALNGDTGALVGMPDLLSVVGPGVMNNGGEISSEIFSYNQGATFESSSYYAVLSGENAEEIVGIIFVEGSGPRDDMDGVTVRETGGFIVYN